MHYLNARSLHAPEEVGKVGGALGQGRVDGPADLLLVGQGPLRAQPLAVVLILALAVELGALHDGKGVLQTHPVRQPPQGKGGADEVAEFPGAVCGGGIEIDVIMGMPLVGMCADEKLILAFCPAHGGFVADPVGLLRRDLPLEKGLPDLIAQRPLFRRPARFRLILAFHQHKLSVGGFRIAEVGGHGPQLFRVQAVVKTVFHGLQGRPLGGPLVGLDVGCSRGRSPFL